MVIGWYYDYTRTVEAGFLQNKKKSIEKIKKNLKKNFKKNSKKNSKNSNRNIFYIYHGWVGKS